ncbi:MAG: hypothetical protein K0B87_00850 [Candidatus Syntrophosphaera sp.]|nr:hypothetical protein [Candidatus Syntrophosphaera sp.]
MRVFEELLEPEPEPVVTDGDSVAELVEEKYKFIVRQSMGVVKGAFSVHAFSSAGLEIETPYDFKKLEEPMIYRKTIQTPPSELAGGRIEMRSSFYFVDAMIKECRISLEVFLEEEQVFFQEKAKPLRDLLHMEHIIIRYKLGGQE